MFSDRATIYAAAGRGGDGAVAFRREKFVPRGGPSGGDGGDGGSVILVADPSLRDLTNVRNNPHLKAEDGHSGEGSNRTGSMGLDTIIPVPVGTQVLDDDEVVIVDLAAETGGNVEGSKPGEIVVTSKGVRIWGGKDVPSQLPFHASSLYSRNVVNLLTLLTKPASEGVAVSLDLNFEDEIIDGSAVTHAGVDRKAGK